ncbi:Qat anti-phage system QueC-like protein QatC [Nitratireductor sp. CH_MIT9313-5]|uniref:Qat anti-phage system QueC-like protein QatC n=1 Tax=Nitratireductor sp. CH_MIT9313-5 TaxID=3107764 RepID=UPI003008FA1D
MTRLVFHTNVESIPASDCIGTKHVFLYGSRPPREGTASVGGQLRDRIKRLGAPLGTRALDFLSIALAVTAADTFVSREECSGDGWARDFTLRIPLAEPDPWRGVSGELERALAFLSGDAWNLEFTNGGLPPPGKDEIRAVRNRLEIGSADSVCLFSGGLDSMIGARQLIEEGRTPILVSHSYRGDRKYQQSVALGLGGNLPRFEANANPVFKGQNRNDTTMRTRSIGFLAYGVVASNALHVLRGESNSIKLYVPENGFIALNAPLTRRRIGSHSTRTTHPHFLGLLQTVLTKVGIPTTVENRYRHMTKGQMLSDLSLTAPLRQTALRTVSCGKWKRAHKQCGHCVPCLIRRAAFHAAGITDTTEYQFPNLWDVWVRNDLRDDLMAVLIAVSRSAAKIKQRAASSGPLPLDEKEREGWLKVHQSGLQELRSYLSAQGFEL